MQQNSRNIYHGDFYRTYLLSGCSETKRNQGFIINALNSINDFICCCREHLRRVYFLQYVFGVPEGYEDALMTEEIFTKFIENVIRRFRRLTTKKRTNPDGVKRVTFPICFWAKEVSGNGRIHYHVVFAFDGDFIWSPHKVNEWIKHRWQRCFYRKSTDQDRKAQVIYGYSKRFRSQHYDHLFKHGGLMITHSHGAVPTVIKYRQLYSILSYYAKVYSKDLSGDLGRKPKNFRKSGSVRHYDETIAELDARLRIESKEKKGQQSWSYRDAFSYSEFKFKKDVLYEKRVLRKGIKLRAITKYGTIANTREGKIVAYWETECGTFRFYFRDDESLYNGKYAPTCLMTSGPGLEPDRFRNVSGFRYHPNSGAWYAGLLFGEHLEVLLNPISGKLRYYTIQEAQECSEKNSHDKNHNNMDEPWQKLSEPTKVKEPIEIIDPIAEVLADLSIG